MKELTFRVAAKTDAAGKYNPQAVRNGNEDNVWVDVDLSGKARASITQDTLMRLGCHGMLMAVADGMGGMNAGEVASQIAIDTVRSAFCPESVTDDIAATPESRAEYMESVIRAADANIKADGEANPSRRGMGSTLILAWLMPDGALTLSWIGDSRAYVYNEKFGIHPLSEDHSYVQQLVRKGIITYEQSFDHPQNNIVLRSLGDPTQEAAPQTRQFLIGAGDIILLCSDGLTGVLRDRGGKASHNNEPYKEENLEDIIRTHSGSLAECRDALWSAAERGGWYDNVTLVLCKIENGPDTKIFKAIERQEKELQREIASATKDSGANREISGKPGRKRAILIALILIVIAGGAALWYFNQSGKEKEARSQTDTPANVVKSEKAEEDNSEAMQNSDDRKSLPASTKQGNQNNTPPAVRKGPENPDKAATGKEAEPASQNGQHRGREMNADGNQSDVNPDEK